MCNLVILKKQNKSEVPVTTSQIIAEKTQNNHSSILRVITKYQNDFEEFGLIRFEIEKGNVGRPTKNYYLNENQFLLLSTYLRNNDITREIKKSIIKQFDAMKRFIQHKQSEEYIGARQNSKLLQKSTMDVVKDFVEYAKENGSKSADRYYIIYNKLVNNILGIENNSIDTLDSKQLLMRIKILDYIAKNVAEDMESEVYYKDIYKKCKGKLESMIDFIRV